MLSFSVDIHYSNTYGFLDGEKLLAVERIILIVKDLEIWEEITF